MKKDGIFVFIFSLFILLISVEASQKSIQDRRRWIDKNTKVSDDPRRVPAKPVPGGPEGTLVLRGGRIFDGTGTPAFYATVVIERNIIKSILPPDSKDWPKNAQVIDVSGKTIMPGLIDLHTHITYTEPDVPFTLCSDISDATLRAVERLRYFIESGITSIRDVASLGNVPFRLKEWVAKNRIPGPRIFTVGKFIAATGGHGAEGLEQRHLLRDMVRIADGPVEWRKAVREQFDTGADWIKTGSHFSREEIAAAVNEAHALGLKVCCDAETFYIQWAVEAGVDCIEHPLPRTDETITLMKEKGTEAVPTLIPYIYIFNLEGGYFGSTSRRFTFSEEANLELVGKMKSAGIKMGIGTDLVFDWFRFLPKAYIAELKQFIKTGYTVEEVLVTATKTNAEILGMEDKLGTILPGKLADVIVIDGRPDIYLDELEKVHIVVRDGYVVVKDGQVFIPRHEALPAPDEKTSIVKHDSH